MIAAWERQAIDGMASTFAGALEVARVSGLGDVWLDLRLQFRASRWTSGRLSRHSRQQAGAIFRGDQFSGLNGGAGSRVRTRLRRAAPQTTRPSCQEGGAIRPKGGFAQATS